MQSNHSFTLYHSFGDIIFKYLLAKTKDEHLAKDITQDVFITALEKEYTIQNKNASLAWLLQVAKNKWLNHCRTAKKIISIERANDFVADDNTTNTMQQFSIQHLVQKLETLPPLYRHAVQQADMNDIPQVQLAQKENISVR